MKPIVLVIGTRPEGVKLLPVYYALKKKNIPVLICSTTQHREILDEVFALFNVHPDIELNVMIHNQDLSYLTQNILAKTTDVFSSIKPSMIIVQGDTTTAMAAALSSFYLNIPLCHIEAGLRTETIKSPFPEEMNRRFISLVSSIHCAPTKYAVQNLYMENKDHSSIFLTGNTVVDALRIVKERILAKKIDISDSIQHFIELNYGKKNIVLLTTHRRESHEKGIDNILKAVSAYACKNKNSIFFYPVHPNPLVKKAVEASKISTLDNVHLANPISYKDLIFVLMHSSWVATDSGGIIEEAVSLGKKVLILRNETERQEAVISRAAELVGTETENIYSAMEKIMKKDYKQSFSLYGDGFAAEKIVDILINKIITCTPSTWYASHSLKELE